MSEHPWLRPRPGFALLDLYGEAMPQVYDYLLSRCGDKALAEDLTSETFLAAVAALRAPAAPADQHRMADRRGDAQARRPQAPAGKMWSADYARRAG